MALDRPLEPIPTTEEKPLAPQSIYALSKYDQETMCLLFGRAYHIPVAALRFFNVYGERQALSNPYTGVLAIFAARYLNGKPPIIFEDGKQRRDFVHVRDLARACVLALECEAARDVTLNIGSGRSYTGARSGGAARTRAELRSHHAGDLRQVSRGRHPALLR